MKYLITTSILAVILVSCTDTSSITETSQIRYTEHKPYLPLFPNSTWTYEKHNGDTVMFYTLDYELSYLNSMLNGDINSDVDSLYTTSLYREPTLHNLINIDGYYKQDIPEASFVYKAYRVLAEEVGTSWLLWQVDSFFEELATAQRVVENAQYLVIKEYEVYTQFMGGEEYLDTIIYYDYYQKDIGLVKREKVNINTNDTLLVLNLIDYSIND